jgi:HEAT repeat protein
MIQSPAGANAVIGALADSNPNVRAEAAWACGMIGDDRAIDGLSLALEDADSNVREQAAWALGMVARGKDRRREDEP